MAYTAPSIGTRGPGGAYFGQEPNNRDFQYDSSVPGSGLYSHGIDPTAPNFTAAVQEKYKNAFQGNYPNAPTWLAGLNTHFAPGTDASNPQALAAAMDAYYRQGNTEADKGSFWDDIGGFFKDFVAPVALGAIPGVGPELAAAYGGITGGLDNGILGAITGGLGGFAGGELGSSLATNGIGGTLSNFATGAENFLQHPLDTASGWLGSVGTELGTGLTSLENFLGLGSGNGVAGVPAPAVAGATGRPGTGVSAGVTPTLAQQFSGAPTGTGVSPTSLAGFGGADAGTPGGFAGSSSEDLSKQFTGTPTAPSGTASPSFIDSAVNALWRAAPGGALIAANALMGNDPPPQQAAVDKLAGNLTGQSQVVSQVGQKLLQQFQSGQLNPGTLADIDQLITQQKAQVEDYFARSGTPQSSSKLAMLADIDRKGAALKDNARQQLLASGLSATGQAASTTGQAGNLQLGSLDAQTQADVQQSNALTALLANIARTSVAPTA